MLLRGLLECAIVGFVTPANLRASTEPTIEPRTNLRTSYLVPELVTPALMIGMPHVTTRVVPHGLPAVPAQSPKPPPEPPFNGGQRRSTVAVNGGQRRSTVVDHREPPPDHNQTTGLPSADHRSTVVDCQSMVGSTVRSGVHVAPKTNPSI
ncbi:hypothetical protein Tco_0030156 [Tanacetum coccineum]